MKKAISVFSILLSLLYLTNCNHESKEKLVGIWKLDIMDINHTPLRGSSLGTWLWEFNEEGGYLVNVAGQIEKGIYKISKDKLTLQSVTHKDRPDQTYTIAKLDSANLNLVSVTDKNTSSLSFVKLKGADMEEKD